MQETRGDNLCEPLVLPLFSAPNNGWQATTGFKCNRCEYLLLDDNRCYDLQANLNRSTIVLTLLTKCFSVRGVVSHNLEVVGLSHNLEVVAIGP